jgi:hypothetical protein
VSPDGDALVWLEEGDLRLPLDGDEVRIGREPSGPPATERIGPRVRRGAGGGVTVYAVDIDFMSRFHFRLQRRDGLWYVCDARSAGGTDVDGRKVASDAWHALLDGETINGRFRFVAARR